MKALTIFTPTYNRAYCLHQCYDSFVSQTNQDFIWLIVDDGSTDGTKDLVRKWTNEGKIEIQYVWQENQGMHGAHNTAYERMQTELNVCIDSDDYMPVDAVEKILTFWEKHGNDQVSGLIGLDSDPNNNIIGTRLPEGLHAATLFELYADHGVTGDKKLVYRTELTKQYPYPIFPGEKYVGLAYKYYQLDIDYKVLLMNDVLCCVEYLPDGSSRNMLQQYVKNPKGFSFYRTALMTLPFTKISFTFRQAIHYVSSSLLEKNRAFLKETPQKTLTILALPLGLMLSVYIKLKTKSA